VPAFLFSKLTRKASRSTICMRPLNFMFLGLVWLSRTDITDLSLYYWPECVPYWIISSKWLVCGRLHHFFGNQGRQHYWFSCALGPHIQVVLIDYGFQCQGLDISTHLDILLSNVAKLHLPRPIWTSSSRWSRLDLISCFLYSLHIAQTEALENCIKCGLSARKNLRAFLFLTQLG